MNLLDVFFVVLAMAAVVGLLAALWSLGNRVAGLERRIVCPDCKGSGAIDTGGVGWAHGFPCAQCGGTGLRHTRKLDQLPGRAGLSVSPGDLPPQA